jgi:hypothetical protein
MRIAHTYARASLLLIPATMADAAPNAAALPLKMEDAFQQPAAAPAMKLPHLTPRPPPPLPSKEDLGDLNKQSLAVLQEMCRDYRDKAQLVARLYGEAEPPGKAAEVRGRADVCGACAAAVPRAPRLRHVACSARVRERCHFATFQS